MKIHELKIKEIYFSEIQSGLKTFEIRKNDRNFKVDDILFLREINDLDGSYTGYEGYVIVLYIHVGLGLEDGYVCMSIKPLNFGKYTEKDGLK